MSEATRLRDSTQILLHREALSGLRGEIENQFVVSIRQEDEQLRIIGSPTEIKHVSNFLARNGISVA